MQDQTLRYQNFILKPCSYQLAISKKWLPKLMLDDNKLSEVVETPLTWAKEFDTEEEANTYAIAQAKMFIDKKSAG